MTKTVISEGVAHEIPSDLRDALLSHPDSLKAWESITPLARNEWICWTISVKTAATRENHVSRAISELAEGKRRPCCWLGCIHRTDKEMSPTQIWVTSRQTKTS